MSTITSGTERWLLDTAARHAASSVEAQGFPALSEVEGSPAKNDGPSGLSLLPQAVAEPTAKRRNPAARQSRRTPRRPLEIAAKGVPLGYAPFPKQQQFHASPAKYRLFGGAAGPGKSKALLMEAILQAHEHPGANTLLLRRTFPELEQSLLLYFRRDVPRKLYKSFNESKHVVTWRNNSTTRFGYCQSESDVYQYQGAEFLFIGIDELTLFTLRQWQFLTSRNRCPIPGAFPCMAGATNPGNIGHAWVKSLWIDKQPAPGMENPSEYDPADYDFIPARVGDNPVYAHDENYLKTLRALPSHLRRAFLDGDWEVFAGQYFDNFDCSRHVIRAEQIGRVGFSVGAQRVGPPGRRMTGLPGRRLVEPGRSVEPGGSDVPGADACLDAAHKSESIVDAGLRGAGIPACASRVEARDFSPAKKNQPSGHSSLPQAVAQAESLERQGRSTNLGEWKSWWPRWISIDWGFEHPAAVYWHCAVPGGAGTPACAVSSDEIATGNKGSDGRADKSVCATNQIVTYREFVTRRTTPRDLAHEIVRRSSCSAGFQPAKLPFSRTNSCRDAAHSPPRPKPGAVIPNPAPTVSVGDGGEGPAFSQLEENQQQIPASPAGGPHRPESGLARDDSAKQGSGLPEKIDAIYLSPDAFAHRTGEASIAEQMGDVFAAAGLPRPVPADDDRVGGWMLMYQMLQAGEWAITDNCFELIRTLPTLVRDPVRVEDIEKCDGDDPADAARYGLKSRYAAHPGDPGGWRSRMPLADRIAAHAYSADPTIRAMQSRKFTLEESRGHSPHRIPFFHGRRH